METILSINQLTKVYGPLKAVNNLSFTIEKGNVYGILGPNGSGKSTTLGMVLNVVNKTSGEFKWFDGAESTHEALKKVGAIIEHPNFYPYMTAAQNLELVCKIKGVPSHKVEEKLEVVGLLDRKDSKFRTFSLGMKQRLAIASALLNDPEILILDEPTNGLDPQGIHQIREIIRKIASDKLYSGPVDGINASHGFFELEAENTELLQQFLNEHPSIGKVSLKGNLVTAIIEEPMSASDINRYLFEKGLSLSYLIKRKESLEEQFLQLTNQTTA